MSIPNSPFQHVYVIECVRARAGVCVCVRVCGRSFHSSWICFGGDIGEGWDKEGKEEEAKQE